MFWKTSATFSIALFASIVVFGFPAQESDYNAAVSLVQQGRAEQAIPILQKMLDSSPDDLRVRNLIGIALSGTGRRREANAHFKRALQLDPRFIPALKNLALNELALGLIEQAKSHFLEALGLAPEDRAAHLGLAETCYASRDFALSIAHYEKAGELVFKDPRVAIRSATACIESAQASKAGAILEKIPLSSDAGVQFQAGVLLGRLEMFEAAARRFQLSRAGSSDPYQAGFNLVLMKIKSGDIPAAISTAEEMLAAGSRKAELYNLLAQAYEQAGKTTLAYDALRTATELEPQDETNYLDLVLLCIEHDNYDLGLTIADVGVKRLPSSPRLHLQRGAVLAMKSRLADAQQEFEAASRLSPDNALIRVASGFVLLELERYAEAIDLLRRQSARTPNDPYVLWFLGEAINRSGVKPGSDAEKEAVAALEKSIQLSPQLPQPRALLGKMLLRRGEVDRAAEQLAKALELDPDDTTAIYQLAQALQKKGETTRARQLFEKFEKAKGEAGNSRRKSLIRILRGGSR